MQPGRRPIEFGTEHGERFINEYRFDWRTGAWQHPRDELQPGLGTMAAQPLAMFQRRAHQQTFQDCLRGARAVLSALPGTRRPAENTLPRELPTSLMSLRH